MKCDLFKRNTRVKPTSYVNVHGAQRVLIASMFIATKPTRAVGHVAIIAPGTARPQYLWLGQIKGKGSQ
jgi:hypothetical protein